ncbi:hypothetical protein CEXT_589661 [Caerostris extrusa]|uniref:Uncharacterized protein n=1 Tax=Caerostris extrusa TaxID=172846 RepID=A0AAV4WHK0_CAEEX|nr:hypothetical protein CEXT_589661 [Caerostris extrusa]
MFDLPLCLSGNLDHQVEFRRQTPAAQLLSLLVQTSITEALCPRGLLGMDTIYHFDMPPSIGPNTHQKTNVFIPTAVQTRGWYPRRLNLTLTRYCQSCVPTWPCTDVIHLVKPQCSSS